MITEQMRKQIEADAIAYLQKCGFEPLNEDECEKEMVDYIAGAQRYAAMVEVLETEVRLAGIEHYECDDGFYSCPMAENHFDGHHPSKKECTCGAERRQKALTRVAEMKGGGE